MVQLEIIEKKQTMHHTLKHESMLMKNIVRGQTWNVGIFHVISIWTILAFFLCFIFLFWFFLRFSEKFALLLLITIQNPNCNRYTYSWISKLVQPWTKAVIIWLVFKCEINVLQNTISGVIDNISRWWNAAGAISWLIRNGEEILQNTLAIW